MDLWEVLNAIFFYVLVEGVGWRALPGDFPAWQTVYTSERNWRKDGTWLKIHDQLRQWTWIEQEWHPSPSEAIIDSQSEECSNGAWSSGVWCRQAPQRTKAIYDGWYVGVSVASFGHSSQCGGTRRRLSKCSKRWNRWAKGYPDCTRFGRMVGLMGNRLWGGWWIGAVGLKQVVLRPEQTKGFVLLKKRWVVERTFGWLMGCRRLVRDYELLPETSETFIYLAMIRIMIRRLA